MNSLEIKIFTMNTGETFIGILNNDIINEKQHSISYPMTLSSIKKSVNGTINYTINFSSWNIYSSDKTYFIDKSCILNISNPKKEIVSEYADLIKMMHNIKNNKSEYDMDEILDENGINFEMKNGHGERKSIRDEPTPNDIHKAMNNIDEFSYGDPGDEHKDKPKKKKWNPRDRWSE